jgi:hypothetical protein
MTSARADPGITVAQKAPRLEAYTGIAASASGVTAYGTLIWSFAAPVSQAGWRVRAAAAHGYSETDVEVTLEASAARHRYETTDGDLALGYQADFGRLWLKLYGGVAFRESVDKLNGQPAKQISETGALAIAEAWLRISDRIWASADVKWTGIDDGVSAFSRIGAHVGPRRQAVLFSAGLEAGVHAADIEAMSSKAGLFGQAQWGANELTLSGGLARSSQSDEWNAYGGVSYGRKF